MAWTRKSYTRIMNMKMILALSLLFTVCSAHSEDAPWYNFDSQYCGMSNEKVPTSAAAETANLGKFKVSSDRSELTVESVDSVESYTLRLVGKDKYIAIPKGQEISGDQPVYFFVQVDGDDSRILVLANDSFGKNCGGGLIVSHFAKAQSSSL